MATKHTNKNSMQGSITTCTNRHPYTSISVTIHEGCMINGVSILLILSLTHAVSTGLFMKDVYT